jgi:hypothetical protein
MSDDLYTVSRLLHLCAGLIALVSFWIAGLARKGSRVHVLAGRTYLSAMLAIIATSLVLCAVMVLRGQLVQSAFLGYLVVITAATCWISWRAVRDKRDWARFSGWVFRLFGLLSALAGAGILALGIAFQVPLFMGFSLVGLFIGLGTWRDVRRGPEDAKWWLRQHYRAMTGNGVATHIAFLGLGLPRLLPELAGGTLRLLAWFGPLVIAFAVAAYWDRRYPRTAPVLPRQEETPA